jgi:LuxR family maltose regulon positive regulatory protein
VINRAKLRVPRVPAQTLARDRVTRALEGLGDTRLLTICAPAGSGKTTAVINWIRASGLRAAWLSLDRSDNDPVRLARRIAETLHEALPDSARPMQRDLGPSADAIGTYLPLISGQLTRAARPRIALVLDDYHLIEDHASHMLVDALVASLPAGATVVIVSRTRPPLAVDGAAVFDAEALRFTREESGALLNGGFGLGLADERIAEVDDVLHGWPAGLSLLAWSARRGAGGSPDMLASLAGGEIADYLEEEVLDSLSAEAQTLLLETSILDRLVPDLCAAVLDADEPGWSAADLPPSGLLTVSDGDAVRVHDLVRDALRTVLERRAPERLPTLHARAADWFERDGQPEQALEHALKAGDGPTCARLIIEHQQRLLATGETHLLRRALTTMADPGPAFGSRLAAVEINVATYEGTDARLLVPRARRLIEAHPDDSWIHGTLGVLVTNQFSGDVRVAIALGRAMLAKAPHLREHAVLNLCIAGSLWAAGELDEALAEATRYLAPGWPPVVRVSAHGIASRVWVDRGDAARAEPLATQAIEILVEEGLERVSSFNSVWGSYGDALRLAGKLAEARKYLEFCLELESVRVGSIGVARALVSHVQLEVAEQNVQAARTHARQARQILDTFPDAGAQLYTRLAAAEQRANARMSDGVRGSAISPAESRVLRLLDSDLTLDEIGAHLHLSRNTIKSHVHRLYGRLGVSTRADAVAAARGVLPHRPDA